MRDAPLPQQTLPALEPKKLVAEDFVLARRIASSYIRSAPAWVAADDIISAAYHGLVDAANRYDPARQATFATFASRRIHGEIKDAARRDDTLPRRVRRAATLLRDAQDTLTSDLGRTPNPEETASRLGWSLERLDAVHAAYAGALPVPLQAAVGDGDATVQDTIVAPDELDVEERAIVREMAGMVHEAIATLPMPLALTLAGLYLQDRSPAEVAHQLGVSTARLRALRIEAIAALRVWMQGHYDNVPSVRDDAPGALARAAFVTRMRASSSVTTRLDAAGDIDPTGTAG